MKLNEFINEAKKVLNIKECDGGEGLAYRLRKHQQMMIKQKQYLN